MIDTLAKLGTLLLEHADLIELIFDAIDRGTPKDAIKAAIRRAKIATSDAAVREELGLPPISPLVKL